MDNPYILAAIVGACASLVGATIGGIVSYQVARLQFNANVMQAYRKEWISQFREFIGNVEFSGVALAQLGNMKKATEKEILEKINNCTLHIMRLRHLLRPHIDDELGSQVLKFILKANKIAINAKDVSGLAGSLEIVVKSASHILQSEYDKMEAQSGLWNTLAKKWPVWLIIALLFSLNIWMWFK